MSPEEEAEVAEDTSELSRRRLLAVAADVEFIQKVMDEYESLETMLRSEGGDTSTVSSKSIEIKASIKKLMTDPQVSECLNRLEVEGEPIWGLSSQERELIIEAREKVNDC